MFPSPGGAHTRPQELFAGRYAVDGPLPWGGLATHYRASAEGTPLVLCVLPMDVSRSVAASTAFAELAQHLGAVQSRSIPRVLDAGVIDGVPYLAFQEMRGTVLSDILRDRALSAREVMVLGDDVLDALEACHAQGLVHGDLTPQNVIVTRSRDGRLAARVIGMGVLPLLRGNPDASAHASPTGSGKHAISYMAPELFGGGSFGQAADLYSVGALLYHMAVGGPRTGAFETDAFDDIPALPDVIRRAMAKRSEKRYPSAASMRAALDWVEVEPVKPPPRASTSHAPGTILSSPSARPVPIEPVVIEEVDDRKRQWVRLSLLLALLATLVFFGYWQTRTTSGEAFPLGLDPETFDVP